MEERKTIAVDSGGKLRRFESNNLEYIRLTMKSWEQMNTLTMNNLELADNFCIYFHFPFFLWGKKTNIPIC